MLNVEYIIWSHVDGKWQHQLLGIDYGNSLLICFYFSSKNANDEKERSDRTTGMSSENQNDDISEKGFIFILLLFIMRQR